MHQKITIKKNKWLKTDQKTVERCSGRGKGGKVNCIKQCIQCLDMAATLISFRPTSSTDQQVFDQLKKIWPEVDLHTRVQQRI